VHVGWDWASQNHDVTVIDDAGAIRARFAIGHDEASVDGILRDLAQLAAPMELPVAIERPDGIILERLLAAGHPVEPIHPNSFQAARSRWGAGRAKSDPADSYMLADHLRADGHRLRRLRALDSTTRELQALVRMRDDHVTARTAATNQLHALLEAHWPGANAIFSRLGSTIALAFLADYPTPMPRLDFARDASPSSVAVTHIAVVAHPLSLSNGSATPRSLPLASTRSCLLNWYAPRRR
jgi:transposase